MINLKTPFAVLILLATASSCRKDIHESIPPAAEEINQTELSIAPVKTGINESDWQQGLSWSKVERPTHTVYFTNIAADVTAQTAEQGLVRIFSTAGSGNESLPFETSVNGQKQYWYYQVTEGNIMISVDVYGSSSNPGETSKFKSVILDKTAVAELKSNGKTEADLMNMPAEALTK